MRRDDRDAPEILGRLRVQGAEQLEDRTPPRGSALAGWIIVIALLGVIIYALVQANPL